MRHAPIRVVLPARASARWAAILGVLLAAATARAEPSLSDEERRAAEQFAACAKGDAKACKRTRAANRKGGEAGVGWRCHHSGAMHYNGVGGKADVRSAMDTWTRGCHLKPGRCCYELVRMVHALLKKTPGPRALDAYRKLLERSCELPADWACLRLGLEHAAGGRLATDPYRSRELFMRACVPGSNDGCANHGESFALGLAATGLDHAAVVILEQACDSKRPRACAYAGLALQRGIVGPTSVVRLLNGGLLERAG